MRKIEKLLVTIFIALNLILLILTRNPLVPIWTFGILLIVYALREKVVKRVRQKKSIKTSTGRKITKASMQKAYPDILPCSIEKERKKNGRK